MKSLPILLFCVFAFSSCGGGGGSPAPGPGGNPSPPPPDEPFVLEPLLGSWNLHFVEGDPQIEWPADDFTLIVSKNGDSISVQMDEALQALVGDPGGWKASAGGLGKKAESIERFYGGVYFLGAPPWTLAVHFPLYLISLNSDGVFELEVSISNGETDDDARISHRYKAVYSDFPVS